MQPFVPQQAAPATQPIPGFTAEQTASLQACISAQIAASNEAIMAEMKKLMDEFKARLDAALDKRFGPLPPLQQATQATQQSIPPAPQAKKEEVKETRPQPLHQATVEDEAETTAESTTKHDSSMLGNKSTLPASARLSTTPASRDPAACLSKALLFASEQASFLIAFLGPLLGYIRYSEGMEATGEG